MYTTKIYLKLDSRIVFLSFIHFYWIAVAINRTILSLTLLENTDVFWSSIKCGIWNIRICLIANAIKCVGDEFPLNIWPYQEFTAFLRVKSLSIFAIYTSILCPGSLIWTLKLAAGVKYIPKVCSIKCQPSLSFSFSLSISPSLSLIPSLFISLSSLSSTFSFFQLPLNTWH